MSSDKQRFGWLLFSGLAVLVVAVLGRGTVPIYDGVGFPDEPYRYVSPPASQTKATAAPTDASGLFYEDNSVDVYINSQEQGPQVNIYIDQRSLKVPSRVKNYRIQAKPIAPSLQPKDGSIAGNVYRVSSSSDAGAPSINSVKYSYTYRFIQLRLPQGFTATPVMEYRPTGGAWQQLRTNKVGSDIYESDFDAFGDYALVIPGPAGISRPEPKHRTAYILAVGLLGLLAAMSAVIVAIRLSPNKSKTRKKSS